MRLRLPNAANSEEEWRQVWNMDLAELSPSELVGEIYRAARIIARDPRAIVWRGTIPITARAWADERLELARTLLRRRRPPRGTVRSWAR